MLRLLNHVEEQLVDPQVVRELRMKGGGKEMTLADEDGVAPAAGENFYLGPDLGDFWGSDENHLQGGAREGGFGVQDGGVQLAAVGVALYGDVQGGK